MKNILKSALWALAPIVLSLASCAKEGSDVKLPAGDFFVTFETHQGNYLDTIQLTESDTLVIGVSIGATPGNSVTVNVGLEVPTVSNPKSAMYKLLDMNNQEVEAISLTFPDGTGTQKFKFVATDNDDVDGSRVFIFALGSNTANYTTGVGILNEGSRLPIKIKDDEVKIEWSELEGEWTVNEEWMDDDWVKSDPYKVTFAKTSETTLDIDGFGEVSGLIVKGSIDLSQKVKTLLLPAQEVTTLNSNYKTMFTAYNGQDITAGLSGIVEKEDNGTLTIKLAGPNPTIDYQFGACDLVSGAYLGYFYVTRNVVLTKIPK